MINKRQFAEIYLNKICTTNLLLPVKPLVVNNLRGDPEHGLDQLVLGGLAVVDRGRHLVWDHHL